MASTRKQLDARLHALRDVLVEHRLPLHWETMARIARGKNPGLFSKARDVGRLVALHRELFRPLGDGVFDLQDPDVFNERRQGKVGILRWPTADTALLLGSMCARGVILPDSDKLEIHLRFGGRAFSHRGRTGWIGKGEVGFRISEVAVVTPQALADHVARAIAPASVTVSEAGTMSFVVSGDCTEEPRVVDDCMRLLQPGLNYYSFSIGPEVMTGSRSIKRAFLRGFGLACGLASSGTNLYGSREQVWLRPATENKPLFYQLIELFRSLGIRVYWNDRNERDIAVKINCEDWELIGFGVDWMDAIAAEGARLNRSLASGSSGGSSSDAQPPPRVKRTRRRSAKNGSPPTFVCERCFTRRLGHLRSQSGIDICSDCTG